MELILSVSLLSIAWHINSTVSTLYATACSAQLCSGDAVSLYSLFNVIWAADEMPNACMPSSPYTDYASAALDNQYLHKISSSGLRSHLRHYRCVTALAPAC